MATTATVAVATVAVPAATSSAPTEEEAIRKKKNTDCVYFLASPLTCNKGDDCEFRHSESARLNPRECWYWLGGNCLNRDCPFRHPPLESQTAVTAGPVHPKKPVPCYFFSQGCCAKGAKCQYLHGGQPAVHTDKQHENTASNAMVYRLSDPSKSVPADANKMKAVDENAALDRDVRRETSQTHSRDHGSERRKDNVYRLQDDSKRAASGGSAAAAAPAASAAASSTTGDDSDNLEGRRKQYKENYTWKLTAQKQDAAAEAKQEAELAASRSLALHSISSERRRSHRDSRNSLDAAAVADAAAAAASGSGSGNVAAPTESKEFAGPKSLAQIKQEKMEEVGGKGKRKGDENEHEHEHEKVVQRRRVSNGEGGKGEGEGGEGEGEGGREEERRGGENGCHGADDEDDDFARRLGGLFS